MTRETAIDHLKTKGQVDGDELFMSAYYMGIEALEREKQIEAILDSSLDDDEKVPVIRLIIDGGLRRPI